MLKAIFWYFCCSERFPHSQVLCSTLEWPVLQFPMELREGLLKKTSLMSFHIISAWNSPWPFLRIWNSNFSSFLGPHNNLHEHGNTAWLRDRTQGSYHNHDNHAIPDLIRLIRRTCYKAPLSTCCWPNFCYHSWYRNPGSCPSTTCA